MENAQSQGQGSVILMVIAGTLLGFGLGWFVGVNNVSPESADDTRAEQVAVDGELADSDILPVGDSPILGNPNAPVTIVEFTSMQCPHCGRAGETLKQLVERYPEDVRLVFKHFPLRMQQQARPASIAVEAAHRQGKAFEMKDGLFARLSDYRNSDMEELASEIAEEIGLDVDQFRQDFNDDAVAAKVDADLELGGRVGVRGTPHFFVNGETMSGAQPLDAFAETVERKLEEVAQMREDGVADDQIYVASIQRHLGDDDGPAERAADQPQREAADVHMVDVHDDDAIKGAAEDDVLVTIMEFSSFQCPFCARGAETMRQLLEKHGDEVRLVFKHFPLGNQQMAEPASRAAIAAGNQGKFWEMYDLIYENQRQLSDDKLTELAQQIGVNMDRWRTDWEASETAELVQRAQREGRSAGVRGTPGFLINGIVVSGAQPLNVFEGHVHDQIEIAKKVREETGKSGNELYAAIVEYNKENAGGGAEAPTPEREPAADEPTVIDEDALSVGDSYFKGAEDAPVTIYEFSSFQCPFCARGGETMKQILERYDGQVKLVYKNFPLPFQQQSEPAARAALAAGEQGKFWEMHGALFDNQQRLAQDGIFEELARNIGLNMDQFKADFESEAIAEQVKAEQREGQSVGVRGTPAFFVNGEMVSGAQPVDAFARIIDRHLEDN